MCLYCVLPIMRCAFGAHLDVGLAERRTPCRFVKKISRFLPSFLGKMAVFDKTESLLKGRQTVQDSLMGAGQNVIKVVTF